MILSWAYSLEIFFFAYFAAVNFFYLFLNTVTLFGIVRSMEKRETLSLPKTYCGLEPPISILMPAHNEEKTIVNSIISLLEIDYPEFEIIVINDGSQDATFRTLEKTFLLERVSSLLLPKLPSQKIRGYYVSRKYPKLRIMDKECGGKADALNAGINLSRYPLFCSIDADSQLDKDSLYKVSRAFLDDPLTIAAGGSVRPSNGCIIRDGRLIRAGLPQSRLAAVQVVEYLRAFLFGRLGFSMLNSMMVISGAFGVFQKKTVIEAGGYRTDTVGEDMELVLRLHRWMLLHKRPYRIHYVPDPICWTEVPEHLRSLQAQRIRWHRGLCESLFMNLSLLFHPRLGWIGWFGVPSLIFFEWMDPLFQLFGLTLTLGLYAAGLLSFESLGIFLFLAVAFSILQSINALLLEELSFHVFTRPRHLMRLLSAAIIENLGYRQINTLWRLIGFWKWLRGGKGEWGTMVRRTPL